MSLIEVLKFFVKLSTLQAVVVGRQCKSWMWIRGLNESYGLCVGCGIELTENYPADRQISALEKYVSAMCEESHMVECFFQMATVLSRAGISAVGNKDFKLALRALHDCYRPVQECFRLSEKDSEIFKEASIIEQDVCFHLATAEALQAIKMGNSAWYFGWF